MNRRSSGRGREPPLWQPKAASVQELGRAGCLCCWSCPRAPHPAFPRQRIALVVPSCWAAASGPRLGGRPGASWRQLTTSTPASAMSAVQLMPAPMATPVACLCWLLSGRQPESASACKKRVVGCGLTAKLKPTEWPGVTTAVPAPGRHLLGMQGRPVLGDLAAAGCCSSPHRSLASIPQARAHLCCRGERKAHKLGGAPHILVRRPRACRQLILRHTRHHLAGQLRQGGAVRLQGGGAGRQGWGCVRG